MCESQDNLATIVPHYGTPSTSSADTCSAYVRVIYEDRYDDENLSFFRAKNVLTQTNPENFGKYWLPNESGNKFVLDLGCNKPLNLIQLGE